MRNQYGYRTRLVRTDHAERPEGAYALRLRVMELIGSRPMTRSEIARRCAVHRSTVGRVVDELSCYHHVIEDEDRRLCVIAK